MDQTVITFDLPDKRIIKLSRLVPLPQRDDAFEVDGESRSVRSAVVAVDTKTGDVTVHIRLR